MTGTGILTVTTGGASTTVVTSSANPSNYGNSVTFTNTVTGITGDGSAPSGTVTFYDGATVIGTATTPVGSSGTVSYYTLSISSLTAATHSITASYAGNASYDVSTSGVFSQQVNQMVSTATVTVNNSPATYNGSGQAATVTLSGTNTPGSVIGILTGGAATQAAAGTYAVMATFVPLNTNYTTLTGLSAGNFTINQAASTATVTVNNSPATYNGSGQAATVTLSGTNTVGSVTGILTGGQTLQTNAGTYAVTATFVPTDTNSTTLTGLNAGNFTISPASTFVGASSSENPSGFKDSIFFTATLPSDATGSVVFSSSNGPINTNSVSSGTAISLSITNLPRGTNVITVAYLGGGNYLGSTNTLNQIVTNHPPVAGVMTMTYTAGLPAVIALSVLATNWSDVDGDTVELTGFSPVTTNGVTLFPINLTTNLDGSYVITNNAFLGYVNSANVNDQFSYSISDGQGGTNIGYVKLVVVFSVTGTNSIANIGVGNPTTLTAYGIPGYTYITERATNLAPAIWVDIATNTAATNGVINATDTFWDLGGIPPASAFYQLKWQQP
jgi:hypothetical protein